MNNRQARQIRSLHVRLALKERNDLRSNIDGVKQRVNAAHGAGSLISFLDEMQVDVTTPCIPTGYGALDDLLTGTVTGEGAARKTVKGSGRGYPRGRIIEIYGPESSGKTTLVLELIEAAQQRGLVCGFVDAEHALDIGYAEHIGVNMDLLLLSQPDSAEEALQIVQELVVSEGVGLVVVDSVAALVPQAEVEGDMGDTHVGLQARLMSQACRKLTSLVGKHGCTVIFINQLRQKITMGFGGGFGPQETTPGGNALKFYASIRLDIRRVSTFKDHSGIRSRIRAVKNKVASPFREIYVDIIAGEGVSNAIGDFDPIFKLVKKEPGATKGKIKKTTEKAEETEDEDTE